MSEHTITPEELEKFTIRQRREIVFYLQQLINDSERVSITFNEGRENLLTMLLDVDEASDRLVFDWGGSELANQKLLQSERNHFVCTPQGVRNQFTTGPIHKTAFKNRPAFETRLPTTYTRLQRREFFRLILPMTRRLPCTVQSAEGKSIALTVVDLSIGGVAAEAPGGRLPFDIGQIIPKARIELKSIGVIEVDLKVRNSSEVQRGGKSSGRIGCEFVKLSHAMENQLQRFITDVQREERARLGA